MKIEFVERPERRRHFEDQQPPLPFMKMIKPLVISHRAVHFKLLEPDRRRRRLQLRQKRNGVSVRSRRNTVATLLMSLPPSLRSHFRPCRLPFCFISRVKPQSAQRPAKISYQKSRQSDLMETDVHSKYPSFAKFYFFYFSYVVEEKRLQLLELLLNI